MSDASAHGILLRSRSSALNHRALRAVGGWMPRALGGRLPWLRYATYDLPHPPGDGWVRLRPVLSGICGSDLSLLVGRSSAIMSPFASFPAVLGHEVLAVVEDGPASIRGRRVALDPLISCAMRGLPDCDWCAVGRPALCRNNAEGTLAPGPMIGFCADLPGGWSDGLIAHESQLHPIPDEVPDDEAVLVEPMSVALHAVLADPPSGNQRVLVIGGGALGLGAVAALRMTAPEVDITVIARHALQADLAGRLGATHVLRDRRSDGDLADRAAAALGARVYRTFYGEPVLSAGYHQVIDAVGSASSVRTAITLAERGGRVSVVGGPGQLEDVDWTLVWTRELRLEGSYVYGAEPSLAGSRHTYDHLLDLLARRPGLPIGEIVTHRFGLRDWRRAIAASLDRGRQRALKIVFDPSLG
jgi:threonine dehydrogenase-like Zn-dependent dehydrogenase